MNESRWEHDRVVPGHLCGREAFVDHFIHRWGGHGCWEQVAVRVGLQDALYDPPGSLFLCARRDHEADVGEAVLGLPDADAGFVVQCFLNRCGQGLPGGVTAVMEAATKREFLGGVRRADEQDVGRVHSVGGGVNRVGRLLYAEDGGGGQEGVGRRRRRSGYVHCGRGWVNGVEEGGVVEGGVEGRVGVGDGFVQGSHGVGMRGGGVGVYRDGEEAKRRCSVRVQHRRGEQCEQERESCSTGVASSAKESGRAPCVRAAGERGLEPVAAGRLGAARWRWNVGEPGLQGGQEGNQHS